MITKKMCWLRNYGRLKPKRVKFKRNHFQSKIKKIYKFSSKHFGIDDLPF